MTIRSYASPEAFKHALEKRLRDSTVGPELARRRQLLVFDRLLARIVAVLGDAVTLKGGLVLEIRLERARTTKDVEIEPDEEHPEIQNDGVQYEGLRFRAECKLAGKIYGSRFGVDVAFGDPMFGEPDVIVAEDILSFVGVEPPTLRLYPVETHVAEKLHAYTMPRPRPNTRVKDLPDLALLGGIQPIDAARLRMALEQTFTFRKTHPLPASVPEPQIAWSEPYAAMARENRLV